jgi:two-component system chemotaxis response regulator CheB
VPEWISVESQLSEEVGAITIETLQRIGKPSSLTCPECHGALWEMDTHPLRYRCHTGHASSLLTLLDSQDRVIEESIWAAVRALHEKEVLHRRLAKEADFGNASVKEHERIAELALKNAETLKAIVCHRNSKAVSIGLSGPSKDKRIGLLSKDN